MHIRAEYKNASMIKMWRTFLTHTSPNRNSSKENDDIFDKVLSFWGWNERHRKKANFRENDKRQEGARKPDSKEE